MNSVINHSWVELLKSTLEFGDIVSPRGKLTREVPQNTFVCDMRQPVLTIPERKLSYRFMAAEAFWILSGDNTVAGIAPWNKNIAEFSDDGRTFFGAYGPKITGQLDHIVRRLAEDPDSRQAGLTIWRENPPQTKDVPCTIAIFASWRGYLLNLHVFMRSSDIWLGLPYDVFNFSMLAHLICCRLNDLSPAESIEAAGRGPVEPGTLYLTAASSHLYEQHFDAAKKIVGGPDDIKNPGVYIATPEMFYTHEGALMSDLRILRESSPGDRIRWWE